MNQPQTIIDFLRVAVFAVEFSVLLFIVQYTRLAPWWKDQIGRTIVLKDILLFLALIPTTLTLFFNFSRLDSTVSAWIDIGIFFLIAVVMIWRTIVWQRIHDTGNVPKRRVRFIKKTKEPEQNPAE